MLQKRIEDGDRCRIAEALADMGPVHFDRSLGEKELFSHFRARHTLADQFENLSFASRKAAKYFADAVLRIIEIRGRQTLFDLFYQFFGIDGLFEKARDAAFHGGNGRTDGSVAGEADHLDGATRFPELQENIRPFERMHVHIEQEAAWLIEPYLGKKRTG